MTDPDVALISTDVAKHENDFVLIRQRYREKNPKYILAAASLDGLKQQLAATALKVRTRIQESLRIAYQNALTSQHGLEDSTATTRKPTPCNSATSPSVSMCSPAKLSRTRHSLNPSSAGSARQRLRRKSRRKKFASSSRPGSRTAGFAKNQTYFRPGSFRRAGRWFGNQFCAGVHEHFLPHGG